MIEIRPAQTPQDFSTLEELQRLTFNWSERNLTPRNTLKAWSHAGGIVLCAFDGYEIVGFVASFLGEIGKKRCQWSHLAGVLPNYRRQGIARQLKFAQREAALAQGIDLIGWTFDPLRRENAIFNVQILGVRCHLLHENFYGEMSGLSAGRPTDRFEVHWHLKDAKVKKLAQKPPSEAIKSPLLETYVTRNDNGIPSIKLPSSLTERQYGLELPNSLDNAIIWYEAVRATVKPLFAEGYGLAEVYSSPDDSSRWGYILQKGEPWFLYVVETSDGTLYTGITNNLAARIQAHNSGKGAAYTAARRPVKLIAVWEVSGGKPHASRLERRFKMLSRPQKIAIIQKQTDFEDARHLDLVTANLDNTS